MVYKSAQFRVPDESAGSIWRVSLSGFLVGEEDTACALRMPLAGSEWTSVYVKEPGGLPGQAGAKQGTSPRSEEASGWCSLAGRRQGLDCAFGQSSGLCSLHSRLDEVSAFLLDQMMRRSGR